MIGQNDAQEMKKYSTIRSQLLCLFLACVTPFWLIAGYLVFHAYTSKIDKVHAEMLENTRALTMVVDRELMSVRSALLALASSPSFRSADFRDIHRQAREILASYPGADIIVADATGQQLVNSYRPFGSVLPKRNNPALVQELFRTGKPVVSNLFFGAVTKRPLVAIDVPVTVDGKVIYDLSMTFPSDRLAGVVAQRKLADQWYCSIVDRQGTIVVRTRNPEKYVGKQVTMPLRDATTRSDEGKAELSNVAGIPVLLSFCKSPFSRWTVVCGVPKATVMAEVYQWMWWAIGLSTLVSLIGVLVARAIAGRIAGDIRTLVAPAYAIGAGESVTSIGVRFIRETAEVAGAVLQASELLHQRSKERDRAERRLAETIVHLQRETAERLRAMEELRQKEQLLLQQSRQAALGEMIGNVAHQWRQPLNSLGLLIQQPHLLHQAGQLNGDLLDESSAKAMEIVQHMSRTIDDFRNFFKPDKEKVPFSVREEVARTLSLIEGSFQELSIAVEVDAQAEPVVDGYPNEFCQVLINILTNARDAMAEREIRSPKVLITIGCEGEDAVITIADNAGGIPEGIIGKVFDPYFTTKGPQVGTGVGLFMSKTIIEKNMGGLLSVRNTREGAEFRIDLSG